MDEGAVPCSSKRTHEQDLTEIKLLTTVHVVSSLLGKDSMDKE